MLGVVVFCVAVVALAVGVALLAEELSEGILSRGQRSFPVIVVALGGTVLALLPSTSSPEEAVRRQSLLRGDLSEIGRDEGFDGEQTFLSRERVEELLTHSSETWYEDELARDVADELEDRGYRVTIADPEMLGETYGVSDEAEGADPPGEPRRGMTGVSLFD